MFYVNSSEMPVRHRGATVLAVFAFHALLLFVLGNALLAGREMPQRIRALAVRLLEPAAPPQIEAAKPEPAKPVPKRTHAPLPVLTAAPTASSTAAFYVAPQPEPTAAPLNAPVVANAPAPLVAARFDADYLQNPKPVYPAASRRLGEEGNVVLRVRVSAEGKALAVDVRQSSGYARLDEAARAAVEQWRFVPARQGADPVESTVLVPLKFTLNN